MTRLVLSAALIFCCASSAMAQSFYVPAKKIEYVPIKNYYVPSPLPSYTAPAPLTQTPVVPSPITRPYPYGYTPSPMQFYSYPAGGVGFTSPTINYGYNPYSYSPYAVGPIAPYGAFGAYGGYGYGGMGMY